MLNSAITLIIRSDNENEPMGSKVMTQSIQFISASAASAVCPRTLHDIVDDLRNAAAVEFVLSGSFLFPFLSVPL